MGNRDQDAGALDLADEVRAGTDMPGYELPIGGARLEVSYPWPSRPATRAVPSSCTPRPLALEEQLGTGLVGATADRGDLEDVLRRFVPEAEAAPARKEGAAMSLDEAASYAVREPPAPNEGSSTP